MGLKFLDPCEKVVPAVDGPFRFQPRTAPTPPLCRGVLWVLWVAETRSTFYVLLQNTTISAPVHEL